MAFPSPPLDYKLRLYVGSMEVYRVDGVLFGLILCEWRGGESGKGNEGKGGGLCNCGCRIEKKGGTLTLFYLHSTHTIAYSTFYRLFYS
jgi:hypothetical protein